MNYSDPTVIMSVQTAINAAGYQPALVVDGKNGPKTIAAVKAFQGIHHLTQDGIIGPQTVAATIAPTPAAAVAATPVAADPLAALQAQIAQLTSQVATAPPPSPPLLSVPAVALSLTPGGPPATAASLGPPGSPLNPLVKPTAPLTIGGIAVPAWAGTAAGAVIGLPIAGLIGMAIGAAAGAAVDVGRNLLGKKA